MQIWLGVWLDSNQTTSTRQMNAMYDILNQYGTKYFKGVIIGNEVLFRKDLTAAALEQILTETKANLKKNNIDLPVATSDLGSSWTPDLVSVVDIVMANVHPFFGGVPAEQAAGWTWNFWQQVDVYLTKGIPGKQNIIAETGWPSQGGNDCGVGAICTSPNQGAIAGIDEMNTFMNGWVCDALTNGTEYFW
jgi:exo-beta-1,3-glucanase (GH17 family)